MSSEHLVDRIVKEMLGEQAGRAVTHTVADHIPVVDPPAIKAASYSPDRVLACGADRVSCTLGLIESVRGEVGRMIDHTLLKPNATRSEVERLCREAREYKFASVCVNPYRVSLCHSMLESSQVKVCTVIGFPLGANSTRIKVAETRQAVRDGAGEVDMVINLGAVKDGDWRLVEQDIAEVVEAAGRRVVTKVILETCLLSDEEIVRACLCAQRARANFVKTSTGFSTGGATAEHVRLMRRVVGAGMGVKASGGVRSFGDAVEMIESGANRIGASASVAIVGGSSQAGDGY